MPSAWWYQSVTRGCTFPRRPPARASRAPSPPTRPSGRCRRAIPPPASGRGSCGSGPPRGRSGAYGRVAVGIQVLHQPEGGTARRAHTAQPLDDRPPGRLVTVNGADHEHLHAGAGATHAHGPDRPPRTERPSSCVAAAGARRAAGAGFGAATPSRVSSAHSPATSATRRTLMAARRTFASMAARTRAPPTEVRRGQ